MTLATELFPTPKLAWSGDAALTVTLGRGIAPAINDAVLALDAALQEAAPEGLIETVPAYCALTIHFEPLTLKPDALTTLVKRLARERRHVAASGRRWTIPTAYGGALGFDLAEFAQRHGRSEAAVVDAHARREYRVYMLGFMIGFAFLGGLEPWLATPRREIPRRETPAGSVGIGGAQTGIFSLAAPSGWHMLGRTPVRIYDPQREPPILLKPGDVVRFEPISPAVFAALERRAQAGEAIVAPQTLA